jgi:hypothetical protein
MIGSVHYLHVHPVSGTMNVRTCRSVVPPPRVPLRTIRYAQPVRTQSAPPAVITFLDLIVILF